MIHQRAGTRALAEDLIDVAHVVSAYYTVQPDPGDPSQQVVFGTSGHRGSSVDGSFNEAHIAATTQAIVEYRHHHSIRGPVFVGRDPHALSEPAQITALEVLAANQVEVFIDSADRYTPTPALSHAILKYNAQNSGSSQADGIVVTPSHNPPSDGGFKYNPPHGGPADTEATSVIAARANELLADNNRGVNRIPISRALTASGTHPYDYCQAYVSELGSALNMEAIAEAGLHIGADPLGGASVDYWAAIAERYSIDLTVVNPEVDPTWRFMTLDWDGAIRMDCSSPHAMASVISHRDEYQIVTGNDADADRHGIVTGDAGLMNPNHFLAVAIDYLCRHRPQWSSEAGIGKTLVSSSMIDRVAAGLGRTVVEVPVGFKWFVPGLLSGSIGFGGEESAGGSFLRQDGTTWTTDKDGLLLCLLASEMLAVTGSTPSEIYQGLTSTYGEPAYARLDAPATRTQKSLLAGLSADQVTANTLAGEPITGVLTHAPGNGAAIGGLKVQTESAWFAARPSGTEDVYKIYAESFKGSEHLSEVQAAALELVSSVLG